ncbi:MAG: hydrogen peroxide-inducible genes activator, partial [Gammaproteobacteria bacterium]|nr:hydrogen peroxide-inducible genes activator [Gammaproteobacteria bacterium]
SVLGVALLERTKRKVMPTPLGLQVAEKARLVLQHSADLVEVAQGQKAVLTGPLRLGLIPTIGPFLLPKVLAGIRRQFPLLELYLVEDQSHGLLKRLDIGEIDGAILALPYDLGRLEHQTFWQEIFWVAFPARHAMAQGGAISSAKLPMDELMILEEGHCLADHALSACHKTEQRNQALFQGTSLYTLIEMVAGGQGITFLPEMAVDSAIVTQSDIALRRLADKGPHREISLVWRPTYRRKKDLSLLAECIGERIAQSCGSYSESK